MSNFFEIKKICCVGAGYVGGPTMAVIADNCPNIKVTVVDIDKEKINAWNNVSNAPLPIYEPGLENIVKNRINVNLFFSTDIESSISEADLVFLSVNTPTKTKGLGAGMASDLKWIEASARQISEFAKGYTIIVEKSTVPVKTAQVLKTILNSNNDSHENDKGVRKFDVLSNPEFLAEGTAINDLQNPDRVLIGGDNSDAIDALKSIYLNWISPEKIISTNLWSSELSKLTANAFLAQRISSINAIGALCEATGANVNEVSNAIGRDHRIGDKFLNCGPGFGGSCFKKDILNLIYLCDFYRLKDVADYWEGVLKINEFQMKRISNIVTEKLFGTLTNKKISILGFAFKKDTNDIRESPAIQVSKDLIEEGAKVLIHDPKVKKHQIEEVLGPLENVSPDGEIINSVSWDCFDNISQTLVGADAVLILTEWDEYKNIDWANMKNIMRNPAWIFDTRSILDATEIKKTGLNLWTIGNGSK